MSFPTKQQLEKMRQRAFSRDTGQIQAFKLYCEYMLIPQKARDYDIIGQMRILAQSLLIPFKIPIVILGSSIFVVSRQAGFIAQSVEQYFHKKKLQNLKTWLQQTYKKHSTQISDTKQQQAMSQASHQLFIENKKRLIVMTQFIHSRSKQEARNRKELMFVIDEEATVYNIVGIVQRGNKQSKTSTHIMAGSKVLNSSMKIKQLKTDELGIIKLCYTQIEAYG